MNTEKHNSTQALSLVDRRSLEVNGVNDVAISGKSVAENNCQRRDVGIPPYGFCGWCIPYRASLRLPRQSRCSFLLRAKSQASPGCATHAACGRCRNDTRKNCAADYRLPLSLRGFVRSRGKPYSKIFRFRMKNSNIRNILRTDCHVGPLRTALLAMTDL